MTSIRTLLLSLLLLYPVVCENSENSFQAISSDQIRKYHFDLARHFFRTPEEAKTAQAKLNSVLSELESMKGVVSTTPENLLKSLELYDAALIEFFKNYTYFYLRSAINTKDSSSADEASHLDSEFSKRTSFLRTELAEIDETKFEAFQKRNPELQKYHFAVLSSSRYKPHLLSLKEEELLSASYPYLSEWQFDLYQKILSETQFADLKTSTGTLNVRKDRLEISSNSDREIRREGFIKLYEAYASKRNLYAFALLKLVNSRNQIAQERHFHNAPEQVYFDSFWTERQVSELLEQISQSAQIYKRYQMLRTDHVKKRTQYEDVNFWDLQAITTSPPRFSIDRASEIIRNSLAPLGSQYSRELQLLLDPENGRMDIVAGANRKSGGFSKGFPGIPTVFFASGYQGFYNDVRILTHESTHAIHRQLMSVNSVLPVYAEGPHYLFESFAIFNEFLLPDYLYNNAKDPEERAYFLEQFLDGKGMALFYVAQDALLEQAIYDGVQKGEIDSVDDLDKVTEEIAKRFSIWADKHKEFKMRWITNSLFYEDPLYQMNYVYGSLLALKYYSLFQKNPKTFVPQYVALLKNGFNAPPEELLKQFLNIDLNDPQMLSDDVELLTQRVNQLAEEYSKSE
jgi:oligoendopeptidase F